MAVPVAALAKIAAAALSEEVGISSRSMNIVNIKKI